MRPRRIVAQVLIFIELVGGLWVSWIGPVDQRRIAQIDKFSRVARA